MKQKIISFHDFFNKENSNKLELIAKKIKSNRRLERMFIFTAGSLMYAQKVLATEVKTGKITQAGVTILSICREIGYWACIIMCVMEIIRSLMQGDTKGITKIIAKYTIGFAALYMLPWMFDIIKSIFS